MCFRRTSWHISQFCSWTYIMTVLQIHIVASYCISLLNSLFICVRFYAKVISPHNLKFPPRLKDFVISELQTIFFVAYASFLGWCIIRLHTKCPKFRIPWHYRALSLRDFCFPQLGAFVKLRRALSGLSVRPHGTARPTLDGFLWNIVFEYTEWAKSRYTDDAILYTAYLLLAHSVFFLICRGNSGFIKIWEEWRVLYPQTYVRIW